MNDVQEVVPISRVLRVYGNGSLSIGPGGEVCGQNVEIENRADCLKITVDEDAQRRRLSSTPQFLVHSLSASSSSVSSPPPVIKSAANDEPPPPPESPYLPNFPQSRKRKRDYRIKFGAPLTSVFINSTEGRCGTLDVHLGMPESRYADTDLSIAVNRANFRLGADVKLSGLLIVHASSASVTLDDLRAARANVSLYQSGLSAIACDELVFAGTDRSKLVCKQGDDGKAALHVDESSSFHTTVASAQRRRHEGDL
jgi:hypothetical protein